MEKSGEVAHLYGIEQKSLDREFRLRTSLVHAKPLKQVRRIDKRTWMWWSILANINRLAEKIRGPQMWGASRDSQACPESWRWERV
jgi:hypothetical protein